MAFPINRLRGLHDSILVAGGAKKLPAIRAALAGNYANPLVTDVDVAQQLLAED